ncbi:hypothetical protein M9H77_37202 [Catharanthus roseus]|uniref:Uncharacterized protein n=1 Tax=Catharanthus roseus TaxID=4058 RepID=A0ACB9ZY91_CATRO|nr:hypothetical protein M9H77_37202 [Catharanthus roseus]
MNNNQEKGRPLPKFGEWDVNNPASADGFTVIFAKARDEKKATGTAASGPPGQSNGEPSRSDEANQYSPPTTKKWFCCF